MTRKYFLPQTFVLLLGLLSAGGCGVVDRATELLVTATGSEPTDGDVAATASPESQPSPVATDGAKPTAAPTAVATPVPTPAPATPTAPAAVPPVGSLAEAAGQQTAPTLPTTVATTPFPAGTPSALPAGEKPPSGQKPDGSAATPGVRCTNTCATAHDSECDDGGPLSVYAICELGTDCNDCGPRELR
jgi:hypothetical protein